MYSKHLHVSPATTEVCPNKLTILKESAIQNPTKFHAPHVRLAGSTELGQQHPGYFIAQTRNRTFNHSTAGYTVVTSFTYLHGSGTLQEYRFRR